MVCANSLCMMPYPSRTDNAIALLRAAPTREEQLRALQNLLGRDRQLAQETKAELQQNLGKYRAVIVEYMLHTNQKELSIYDAGMVLEMLGKFDHAILCIKYPFYAYASYVYNTAYSYLPVPVRIYPTFSLLCSYGAYRTISWLRAGDNSDTNPTLPTVDSQETKPMVTGTNTSTGKIISQQTALATLVLMLITVSVYGMYTQYM